MQRNVDGEYNVALGYFANKMGTGGDNNVMLGGMAGFTNSGSGNVFIGFKAGYDETGSNKLYISNSSSSNLITGDFSTGALSLGQSSGTVTILNDLSVTSSFI